MACFLFLRAIFWCGREDFSGRVGWSDGGGWTAREGNVAWLGMGWLEKPKKVSVFGGQEPLTDWGWGRKFSSLLWQRASAESKDSPRIGLVRHLRSYVECRA